MSDDWQLCVLLTCMYIWLCFRMAEVEASCPATMGTSISQHIHCMYSPVSLPVPSSVSMSLEGRVPIVSLEGRVPIVSLEGRFPTVSLEGRVPTMSLDGRAPFVTCT